MYYLIEISTYNNGEPTAKAIYSYETRDEANAAYYGEMRGAIVNASYATELCMIVDGRGAVQRYEYWERNANESE